MQSAQIRLTNGSPFMSAAAIATASGVLLPPVNDSELMGQFLQHRDTLWAFLLGLTRDYAAAEETLQQLGLAMLTEAARGTSPENSPASGIPWAIPSRCGPRRSYAVGQISGRSTRRSQGGQGWETRDKSLRRTPLWP